MGYGFGFRPDTRLTHDGDAGAFLAGLSSTRAPIAFLAQVGGVLNQGQTETCVGQAFKRAIELRAAGAGFAIPPGSALAIRNVALQLDQVAAGTADEDLVDEGCSPSVAVAGIRQFGFPLETAFPFSAEHAADKVTLGELESADRWLPLFVDQFRGIVATGDARLVQVRAALAGGMPVPLAVNASRGAFQTPGSGPIDAPAPGTKTDHMVQLVDFREDGGFLLLNSWGTGWGDSGLKWVTPAFVQAADHLFVVELGGVKS